MKSISLLLLQLLFFVSFLHAQQFTTSGLVTDVQGNGLSGVTVVEKGNTANAVVTDAEGQFSITVSSGSAILVFSYTGAATQEVNVNNRASLGVAMETSAALMEEVVVTGYSAQKRSNITGSVAIVSAEKLNDVTTPNVSNMLQGKVAGVDVITNTGQPGGQPTIRIRGRSSIRSSVTPLWVLDGVIQHETPILNPVDVQSISVLKDAAAGALYGSRGANGVIVVTTKVPVKEGSEFTVNARTGVSMFNTGNFKMNNTQQMYDIWEGFANPSARPAYFTPDLLNTNTDWLKQGTHAGKIHDINVGYAAKAGKGAIFTSGNYYKEEGSVKGYEFERLTARINMDYPLTSNFIFKPKIVASYSKVDNRQHNLYDMYMYLPWDNPYYDDGTVVNPQNIRPGRTWYSRDGRNYLYDLQWNYSNAETFNVMSNLDFEYRITPNLVFTSTNNITYFNQEGLTYEDPKSVAGLANQGRIQNSMAKRVTRFTNQMLTYTRTFDKHMVRVLGAYEYNDYTYNNVMANGKGLTPGSATINAASQPLAIEGTKNQYAFQSLLFNANYSYDDRYNLQASFRRDGASRFGDESKYGNFFAISAAWNIHQEAFFKSEKVDYLRLKASYGGVGNVPLDLYPQYTLYDLNVQYAGNPAAYPLNTGNNSITWEKSYDANFAVEAGFLNRFDVGLDFYNKNTSGLLHFVPTPWTTGFGGRWENIGAVRNRGIEFSLGADIIRNKNFVWHLDFNIGRNTNKITELYGGRQINGNKIYEEGENIDTWFMRKWAGVNPDNGTPTWELIDANGTKSTTGNYATATLQKVGNSTPDFFGGFSTSVVYKGIGLRANFAYSKGASIYHAAREFFDSDGAYPQFNFIQLQNDWSRWTPDNRNATHPQLVFGGNNQAHRPSSRFIEDVSFLRMRNVTLDYSLPASLLKHIKVKSVKVYVSADNLLTFTKFSGSDPESMVNADVANSGASGTAQYPVPKRIMFGLNFTF